MASKLPKEQIKRRLIVDLLMTNINILMIGKLLFLILLSSAVALKISPLSIINSTNQLSIIGVDVEAWL